MSVLVWAMIGIAVWHFAVLVPDRFAGGIIGALAAALCGAMISGYLLPLPGVPGDNPPGYMAAFWALPDRAWLLALVSWYARLAVMARMRSLRSKPCDAKAVARSFSSSGWLAVLSVPTISSTGSIRPRPKNWYQIRFTVARAK